MNGAGAQLQIRFDERYPEAPVKRSIIKAFEETGLPLETLPENPYEGDKGGGGVVLDVNLILQHGPAILDGLIATGIWMALVKVLRSLSGVYAAVRLRIAPRRYWRKARDEGQSPDPVVTYDLPVGIEDRLDEEYVRRIPSDYAEIVRLSASLRRKGKSGEWDTMQIEIVRYYFKPEWLDKDHPKDSSG